MSIPGSASPLLLASTAAAGGYQISRSLRFNSADSAYLSRTPAVAGNQTTWTFSCWIKRSALSSRQTFGISATTGNGVGGLEFADDDTLDCFITNNGSSWTGYLQTTQVFRDPSAWYHIVFIADTNNGTTSDRLRLYVNGNRVTTFNTANYPSSGTNTGINGAISHAIGSRSGGTYYTNGYLADIYFIDGQALTPSSFTEVSATTGQLIPKAYTGSFGTNGFWLKFSDNSNNTATTLGKDYSGNSNNWTPNNLSVTQGTGSYTTNTTGTFAANRGAIKAFDGATSGSDFFAQPADGNTVTIGSLGITGITKLRMWLGKNNSGDPWGTLSLDATNVTSFLTTNYPSLTSTGQWIDLTSQLSGSSLSTITMTSPVANTDVRLAAVEVNDIVLIDRAAPVTAGNDSLVDTPTSYGTDTYVGGEVRGNYATWNPLNKGSSLTVSNGNLDVSGSSWATVLSTVGITAGMKSYMEMTVTTNSAGGFGVTINPAAENSYSEIAGKWWVFNYSSNFVIINQTSVGNYSPRVNNGDVLQLAIDYSAGKVFVGINNVWINSTNGTDGNPATGANPTFTITTSQTIFPFFTSNGMVEATNFGQRAFAYTAPSGFKALCDTNLAAPVVAKPSTVFDVITYTGTGSSLTLPNGSSTPTSISFTPDFAWLKGRSGATNHALYDAVRGVQKDLVSNSTSAETTETTGLTAFGTNTFTVGSLAKLNTSSSTYVAWAWYAGGSTVSNTSGSISSGAQVKANPSSGFSVVTWVGDGTGTTRTVGHGLGVAPSLIIAKNRTSVDGWPVYHKDLGNSQIVYLNTTAAASTNTAVWNSTSPTSTVFSIGGTGLVNELNYNYVAYCFAPVAGYSSFGSYTGNGSATDNTFVYTGMRPRFVMLKRSDSTGNWVIWDAVRNSYNVANSILLPNSSAAEYSPDAKIDILSNGFKVRDNSSDSGINGATYIYAAFAESPFQYARAR